MLTDVNGRKWVLVPTDGHWDMTKAALALIKSTGVNPGDLTVGGLAAAIENAIAAAPEFEGSISEHDETIRQLRAQLAERLDLLKAEKIAEAINGRAK